MNSVYDPSAGADAAAQAEMALRLSTACRILATALLDPIGAQLAKHFATHDLVTQWPLTDASSKHGVEVLIKAMDEGRGPGSEEAIKRDHLYLFGDAGKPLACPYESPYVGRDGLVFDEATFQVRAWYRKYGFQIGALNREPDDHLGYELAFAAILTELISQNPQAAEVWDDLADFTRNHLSVFGYAVAEGIATHANTDFYRACAHFLTGALDTLRNFTCNERN